MENDVSIQNHNKVQSTKSKNSRTIQLRNSSIPNSVMSSDKDDLHRVSVGIVDAKLNQATPPIATNTTAIAGGATTNTSNVIQTNNKNTMLSSFVSVIEGTKDLSISDEKQRSPKHQHHNQRQGSSKTASNVPKQSPLLENTNLHSVEAKLTAAPTVISPNPSSALVRSGIYTFLCFNHISIMNMFLPRSKGYKLYNFIFLVMV